MRLIVSRFFRSSIPVKSKTIFVRHSSSSKLKLSENDVEEIEIPVPWGHISGKWWGDKTVTPVLAIHGWQDNANSFNKLIPLLDVPSVLAIDLPGHGLSSHVLEGRTYDFSELLVTIHRIKKYFNWEQMPLLTHSFGSSLGFAYTSEFPTNVKWVINFECARTLMTLFRNNLPRTMANGIDGFLKIEKMKKERSPPAYKLSKMVEMMIEGSLGSISSPEAALTLLKRGMKEAEKPSTMKDDKTSSDLGDFVTAEKERLATLSDKDKEYVLNVFLGLMDLVKKQKENLKNSPLLANDDKYYTLNRDPSLKALIFSSFDEEFVIEASKSIKCPFLSIRAKQGFLFGSTKKLYEETVENLKRSSIYLEHHDVEGTHHAHLNTPELLAPIMNDFIKKCETLKRKWWGSKNRRPILCIHGWQDNANSFNTLIPQLSPEFSYLAIDLPGHGLSSHYQKGFFYKIYDVAILIRRIQNHFSWNTVSLIGHSYGAISSFLFSSVFPNSVDFFVAIDAIKPLSKDAGKDIKEASKKIEKLLRYDSLSESTAPSYTKDDLLKVWIKGSRNALTESSCYHLIERGASSSNDMFKIRRDSKVKHNIAVNFTHKENLKLAEAITCNVMFLKADGDTYFEDKNKVLEVLGVIKQNAKYFEEHLLTGTHYIHLNNPEVVAPVINSFIQRVGGQQEMK